MALGYTKSMCAAAMTGAHLQAPAPDLSKEPLQNPKKEPSKTPYLEGSVLPTCSGRDWEIHG